LSLTNKKFCGTYGYSAHHIHIRMYRTKRSLVIRKLICWKMFSVKIHFCLKIPPNVSRQIDGVQIGSTKLSCFVCGEWKRSFLIGNDDGVYVLFVSIDFFSSSHPSVVKQSFVVRRNACLIYINLLYASTYLIHMALPD